MRTIRSMLLVGVILHASPAIAADALKFGPAPAWVAPQAIPAAPESAKDRPVALLLHDQQTMLRPGSIITFTELAFKIQKPEGLAAGNLSVAWNPATDTATVNKLEIHRGDEVIDVLKSGQTFTTLRRESNLESAMLDGVLTANIQPEGLREGDVVVLATTSEHVDPVLKEHVETIFAPWGEAQIGLAHARLSWPAGVELKIAKTGDLPPAQQTARDGVKSYELVMRNAEPVIAPKGAPVRFKIGRLGEATDFRSWADAAKLMMPLYSTAAVVAPSGPLRDELEKIRKASTDPKVRAEQALRLVQERVRYVALLMGEGGYVPANADSTWSRRFGDCKAKTALLLALLHELGIAADPVMANLGIGDAVAARVPMIAIFNHVFVRAHIAGKDYWLDGTRTGDTTLDAIDTPDYGWVLPLTENAQLVHLVRGALAVPSFERHVDVDASNGVFATAAITISETYRKDSAVEYNAAYSQLSADQRSELMRNEAKGYFDSFDMTTSSVRFDPQERQLSIVINGKAKLNWDNGWFFVPTSSIAFDPDFDRPAGAFHDVPIKVSHPRFVSDIATVKLPTGFAQHQKLHAAVHETLAGVEYARTESVAGDTLAVDSSERSITAEVPYKEAVAAAPRLRALDKDSVYLQVSADTYHPTDEDWPALAQQVPASAADFIDRGMMYMNGRKYAESIADFTAALKLEPSNEWALADRALSHAWLQHYDEAQKDLAALDLRNAENVVGLRAHGIMAEFKDDCAKALGYYARALAKNASDTFTIGHKAICEANLSKSDEALADSATALKADPSWMDLRLLRANIFVDRGINDQVAKEADLITAENPRSTYAYVIAGRIYARLARTKDAMKAFDTALGIKPDALVYINRAQSRPFTDRTGRLADLDAALKLEPANPDALAEKAEQLAADGDVKAAKQLYDHLVELAPDVRFYKIRRAVMLSKTGSVDEAAKLFTQLRSEARSASDLNGLCWAKATSGILLERALDECHEALKREPDSAASLDSLALVELRLGQIDQAIADYSRAIVKNKRAASYMGRALAYGRKGNEALAAADLKQALQLDPDEQTRFAEFGLPFEKAAAASKVSVN